MQSTENSAAAIYAPPKASLEQDGDYYVRDGLLVAQSPLLLPDRCIKSGETGPDLVRFTRTFIDNNLLAVSVRRRRCKISYCLSRRISRRLKAHLWLGRLAMLSGVLVLLAGLGMDSKLGALLASGGLVLMVVGGVSEKHAVPLKVVKHSKSWSHIRGCCAKFLAAVQADRIEFPTSS